MNTEQTGEGPELVIGVACNKDQCPEVWSRFLSMRVPERVAWYTAQGAVTDKNRNEVVKWFLASGAEWLFFLDDDVQPQPDTLERLMSQGKDMVAGIYYRRKPPCDPLMYIRQPDGWYRSVSEWNEGSVIQVDGVGMGCTLIHRRVFEKILASHVVYARANGSLGLAYLGDVYKSRVWTKPGLRICKGKGAEIVQQVWPLRLEDLNNNQAVPFYAFEYGRTEDFYFCELAQAAGVEIWVDTSVELYHWGYARVGREQFEQVKAWMARQGEQDTAGDAPTECEETLTE